MLLSMFVPSVMPLSLAGLDVTQGFRETTRIRLSRLELPANHPTWSSSRADRDRHLLEEVLSQKVGGWISSCGETNLNKINISILSCK